MGSPERATARNLPVIPWLVALGVGILLVVVYEFLAAHHVGKIGAPTDIGGGGIFLLGVILSVVGAVGVVVAVVSRGLARHRRQE